MAGLSNTNSPATYLPSQAPLFTNGQETWVECQAQDQRALNGAHYVALFGTTVGGALDTRGNRGDKVFLMLSFCPRASDRIVRTLSLMLDHSACPHIFTRSRSATTMGSIIPLWMRSSMNGATPLSEGIANAEQICSSTGVKCKGPPELD